MELTNGGIEMVGDEETVSVQPPAVASISLKGYRFPLGSINSVNVHWLLRNTP
jgi:hypothetical protein